VNVGPVLDPADPERENVLLHAIIEATSSGHTVEPLAAAVARLITDTTATDVCFVHVLDDGERSLTLAGATPPFDGQVGRVRLPLGSGVTGWVASHREPVVIVEHKEADARYLPIPALRGAEFTSMASVPMATGPAGLVGVLNVHTVRRREFSERDIRLLLVIGTLVAGALHQARMHRQISLRERAHERFAEQVIGAQETERRRLAGDIHDGISQRLVSLSYHLDAVGHALRPDPDEAAHQLGLARGLVDLTLDEARSAISGLRPPVLDDLGLAGGLASLARSIPQIETLLDLDDARLPDHIEIALYRIAQECLQNVVKHAGARVAHVELRLREGRACLQVVDDGVGFDTGRNDADEPGRGYGLRSMAERAELVGGTLQIASRPGGGTTVTARVPVAPVQV
jgi:two-component system NarL family sensor kinase